MFGDGYSSELELPRLNDSIRGLRLHQGLKIVKIQSIENTTAVLMGIFHSTL